jgi:hypothetical protein
MAKRYENEWVNLNPATRMPGPDSQAAILIAALSIAPIHYPELWRKAGFEKDPFCRTRLRQCALAGFIDRTLDSDGTELWSKLGIKR